MTETAGARGSPLPRLGVAMLETRFPRIHGDIGNPASYAGPVSFAVVPRAKVRRIVFGKPVDAELAAAFVAAALDLESRGARVITTSCGFAAPLQDRLQAAVSCPVIASALVLLPLLKAMFGARAPVGLLTFDAEALGDAHLGALDRPPLRLAGLPRDGELYSVIAGDLPRLDRRRAQREVLRMGRDLTRGPRPPRALLLECTNLSPYKAALRRASGLPVFDLLDALRWLAGAVPPPLVS